MAWQDIVISIGQWVLLIALIPSVTSKDKPALATSVLTGLVLTLFAFTFFTLSLLLSGASAALVAATWFLLAGQKYRQTRHKE
ncbi:MAG: hypothetical protein Q8P12_00185 [bacterium]|nr:hypothetical protein [bacterium]